VTGRAAYFATAEDMIVAKLHAYQETGSEKHLRDARGMVVTQWGRLNLNDVTRWARAAGVEDLAGIAGSDRRGVSILPSHLYPQDHPAKVNVAWRLPMDSRRNRYDRKNCLEIGQKAEDVFASIATERGWKVTVASNYANIHDHWDLLIEKGAERYRVDVKGMKRLSRHDVSVQDQWMWIELHGVREHDRGWLYDGKAELIAFETKASFIIVRRNDLIKLVEQLVDMNATARPAKQARYKVYSRPGRPDKITMMETEKLAGIRWDEWPKQRSRGAGEQGGGGESTSAPLRPCSPAPLIGRCSDEVSKEWESLLSSGFGVYLPRRFPHHRMCRGKRR